jgi:hypothetical protein
MSNWGSWIFRPKTVDPALTISRDFFSGLGEHDLDDFRLARAVDLVLQSHPIVAFELGSPEYNIEGIVWSCYNPAEHPNPQSYGSHGRGTAGYDPSGLSVTLEIFTTLRGTEAQVVQTITVTDRLPAGVW